MPKWRDLWESADIWPGSKAVYYGHANLILLLGVILLAEPTPWFGPSWSYFPWLPHNGLGMGVTCTMLGILQLAAIRRNHVHLEAILLFLGGFTNWTAGVLIFAEGLFGGKGLQETWWMCILGALKFIQSTILYDNYRKQIGEK